ncbi:MAG: hypothetical protein QOE90_2814 [Thermoplasmata archaeon]|jgi:hypothetical protein|nr:hypothetical protein [Thermoplasmata archaeon]
MVARLRTGGFVLLALTLLAPALAPVGEAQVSGSPTQPSYAICFYGYHLRPGDTANDCPSASASSSGPSTGLNPGAGSPAQLDEANYFEGERVAMTLNANTNGAITFDVECATRCKHVNGDTEGRTFEGTWDGNVADRLVFPDQFTDLSTGLPAGAEGAGTYNSTWVVTAYVVRGAVQPQRGFGTWLQDSFVGDNATVSPGEHHEIHMYGYSDSARLNLTVERREGSRYVPVSLQEFSCVKQTTGQFCRFRYAPDEAANFAGCGSDLVHCYRVSASGTGKDAESVDFQVAPAHLTSEGQVFTAPAAAATPPYARVERTQNVTVGVLLAYPGGDQGFRVPLTDARVPVDPLTGTHVLRVNVIRQDVPTPATVAQVLLAYQPDTQRWQGTWTPPRDAATNGSLVAYQLALSQSRDRYSNVVDAFPLANYTLQPATLDVSVVKGLDSVARTDPVDVQLAIRYHDGELFDDKVNASPLTGCFIRDAQTGGDCTSASSDQLVTLSYKDGVWHARHQYARDYATLGAHKLVLQQDKDAWNNTVPNTLTIPFQVVVGSPRVTFSTVFEGSRGDPIVRADDTLFLNADVSYGDGSPFNNTAVPNPDGHTRTLTALVTKRTTDGGAVTTVPVTLLGDPYSGHWYGSLPIRSNQTDSPLGAWTFALDVADNVTPPNVNHTSFNRTFIGSPLEFREEAQPFDAEIGNKTHFRFSILRQSVDDSAAVDVGPTLAVYLMRWDPVTRAPTGDPIAKLLPPYNGDYHQYAVDYQVPVDLFEGTFVFVVRGGDRDGNMLLADGVSHPFRTFASARPRGVVSQPPVTLQRGDTASVVFDGIVGDTGLDGTGLPTIHVDYFDPVGKLWERKADDVLELDSEPNHLGLFPITIDTNVGVYRFVLQGRQQDRHAVVGVSANFTVTPADVGRIFFVDPPENVSKGESFAFSFERQPGDIIFRRAVLYEGRPSSVPPPTLVSEDLLFNASWGVPFDAPSGRYSLRLEGADRSGNHIDVLVPPIEVQATQLAGKIIGNPARAVARGSAATALFGITYPNGEFYLDTATPKATVFNASGIVADAQVTREGLTFSASWPPPPDADAGADYWFEMSGSAVAGDSFPTLRSSTFKLAPGAFSRGVATDAPIDNVRGDLIVVEVPVGQDDTSAQFSLAYYGPNGDASSGSLAGHDPTSVTLLASTVNPTTGRYVARFVTDAQTPPGSYLVTMKGGDRHGNQISAQSRPFILRTSTILAQWDSPIPTESLREGQVLTTSFTARYQNTNALLDDVKGKPSVALLVDGRASSVKPDVGYQNGHWVVSWQAPATLPRGTYVFVLGGSDFAGNQILTTQQNAVVYDPSFGQSVAKVVPHLLPGPEPALVLAGLAALALVLRRARRS